jgi:predicted nucleic acid-binding protein
MSMRVMLDTNIFDRLLADHEAASELQNRRDVRLVVSRVQLDELSAVPDPARRVALLELAKSLCGTVAAVTPEALPGSFFKPDNRHRADRTIASSAKARCDLLVSGDIGLLEHAEASGIRVMDWGTFVRLVVFKD